MTTNNPEKRMNADLRLWAKWRKTPVYLELGYPKQSAEQVTPNGSDKVLPSWDIQMKIDNLVEQAMPKEYSRIIFARYAVPLRLVGLQQHNIFITGMEYHKSDGLYYFPTDLETAVQKAIGLKMPTYNNMLRCAKAWLLGKAYS